MTADPGKVEGNAAGGAGGTSRVIHNSGNTEWNTPRDVVERAARALGGVIDLDPCTNPGAQTIVKARRWLTSSEYALSSETDWLPRGARGTAFLNPPYAAKLVKPFAERLLKEIEAEAVGAAIWLSNSNTETRTGQMLLAAARAVLFPAGRIKFLGRTSSRR